MNLLILCHCLRSLAKMASGLCDNLLLSIVRAWDFTHPLLVLRSHTSLRMSFPHACALRSHV